MLWSAISRAARTPVAHRSGLAEPAPPGILVLAGDRNYGSEYVTAYELGYRGEISPTMTGSIATFLQRVPGCAQHEHHARHDHSAFLRQ